MDNTSVIRKEGFKTLKTIDGVEYVEWTEVEKALTNFIRFQEALVDLKNYTSQVERGVENMQGSLENLRGTACQFGK